MADARPERPIGHPMQCHRLMFLRLHIEPVGEPQVTDPWASRTEKRGTAGTGVTSAGHSNGDAACTARRPACRRRSLARRGGQRGRVSDMGGPCGPLSNRGPSQRSPRPGGRGAFAVRSKRRHSDFRRSLLDLGRLAWHRTWRHRPVRRGLMHPRAPATRPHLPTP